MSSTESNDGDAEDNNQPLVETRDSWDDERLDFEDETAYVQTNNEYDQLLSRAQMSVVDDVSIDTSARIVGPSGCGKTTLARSLAFDVKIVSELVNEHNVPVWDMSADELALLNHIVHNEDTEDEELCPNCETKSHYERDNKTPTYRCNNCGEEFDELLVRKKADSLLELHEEIVNNGNLNEKLQEYDLINSAGEHLEDYPHSRADAYREIYSAYTDDDEIPSAPYFEVTMSHAKYAKDLIGHPHIGENGTTFQKGKVTEAVEASNEETVVLTLDEINRAPTSAKDELYDALDGRVKVSMDEVGGVEIEGTPENLIIVSTMNKGSGHHVEPLDFAEKRRLGSTYSVDFLGVEYPEKEKKLIMDVAGKLIGDEGGVPEKLADEMVNVANEIRQTASDDSTNLSYGLPTGTLIEWAVEAKTNFLANIPKPVVSAGESSVAEAIYDHSEDEVTKVNTIISKNMEGVEFFERNNNNNNSNTSSNTTNEKIYVCEDADNEGCDWQATESEAPVEACEFLVCPECDGAIEERTP